MVENYDTFFFSGKGGVGKSTVSSAFGVKLAEMGYRTLVVSLDPAHSLSLTFDRKIGEKPTKVTEKLYAVEFNVEREIKNYLERVKREAREILSPVVLSEIEKQIELAYYSPGAFDLATLDLIYRTAILERGKFEKVVFDTAPSGFTVRLLSSPQISEKWLEGLINLRKESLKYRKMAGGTEVESDPVVRVLRKRLNQIRELRELIFSPKTLFSIVVNPETLTVEIGKRTLLELRNLGIGVRLIVANKIESEEELSKIEREFKEYRTEFLVIPKKGKEPKGVESLRSIAFGL
jgi:arsenite-transporting ATPase